MFDRQAWGLIIYDEVHLLPAPVFRITAQLQARRRLGLTAADCTEIRIPQTQERQMDYATAGRRYQFRVAAENPLKLDVVQNVLEQEAGHRILIIGEYLDQLKAIAQRVDVPLITGKTSQKKRDRLYASFRNGEISGLILSRVGNFALDLPDADVLIQVSGKYGSRQEEAQRLGRVLRSKSDGRRAHTLMSLRASSGMGANLALSAQGIEPISPVKNG